MQAFIPFLKAIGRGEKLQRDLTLDEARQAMHLILTGEAAPAQIGAFLITQRVKGEKADEVSGFLQAARAQCRQIAPKVDGLLDLGIPYDGKTKTLQLAPVIALITAAAGQPVIFHGDRNVPTKAGVGPIDVLQGLGVATEQSPQQVERQIERLGIGFLSAAQFAPTWHALLPIRQQFGLRTALNTVEKLLNPANAPLSVSGFFHMNYMENMTGVTGHGAARVWMIQGPEGSIECPPARATRIVPGDPAQETIIIDSGALGFTGEGAIPGSSEVAVHVEAAQQVLADQPGAARDTALLSAGVLLFLAQRVESLSQGVEKAKNALSSGQARNLLSEWGN